MLSLYLDSTLHAHTYFRLLSQGNCEPKKLCSICIIVSLCQQHINLISRQNACIVNLEIKHIMQIYRVSHIKLDRVNGSKLRDLGDKSENLKRMNHFEKFNKANRIYFLQKMLDFSSIMCVFRC